MQVVTDEVRWFFPGLIPSAVLDWFCAGKAIEPAPERTDIYLPLPASFALSVKIREGRLEIKTQSGSSRDAAFPNGVAGKAGMWTKESYRTEQVSQMKRRLDDAAALPVKKQRYLRKFSLDRELPVEVGSSEMPNKGCLFELTQLWLDNRPSWSVALESFGAAEQVTRGLNATAELVFREKGCPVELTALASASYPEWLPAQRLFSDAQQILVSEFEQLSAAYLANEQTGDSRVNLFIALVGGVATAMGIAIGRDDAAAPVLVALSLVLALGWYTINRLVRRNLVTDDYLTQMARLRGVFKRAHPLLGGLLPFEGKEPKGRCLKPSYFLIPNSGGLIEVVLLINAALAGALAGLLAAYLTLDPRVSSGIGVAIAAAAWFALLRYVNWRYRGKARAGDTAACRPPA